MPRNVQPAAERDGPFTPITVQNPTGDVKGNPLRALLVAVDSELHCWARVSIDTLDQLDELLKTIEQLANDHTAPNPGLVLGRIGRLAAIGSRIAADTCNDVDCGRERYEEIAGPLRAGGAA
ncbi:hypothetical protein D3C71_826620 [compost metagenome]